MDARWQNVCDFRDWIAREAPGEDAILEGLHDRLGDHHDLVVQREFLSTGFERLAPDAAFVAE